MILHSTVNRPATIIANSNSLLMSNMLGSNSYPSASVAYVGSYGSDGENNNLVLGASDNTNPGDRGSPMELSSEDAVTIPPCSVGQTLTLLYSTPVLA